MAPNDSAQQPSPLAKARDYVCVMIGGLGVGWLVGLSASPVVAGVVTTLLGGIAAVVSAFVGVDFHATRSEESQSHRKSWVRANPLPLTLMIVAVVLGSALGVFARTKELLGPGPEAVARSWKAAGLPLETPAILLRLFEREMGESRPSAVRPVLFSADETLCNALGPLAGATLRDEINKSHDERLKAFARLTTDDGALKAAVQVYVCASISSR